MKPPSAAASSASRTPSVPRPSPRVSKPQTSTPPSATAAASKPRASSGHPPSPAPTCQQSYCPAAAWPYRPPPPRQHQRRSRAFTTPPSAWSTSTSTPRAASGPVKPTSLGLSHGAVPSQPSPTSSRPSIPKRSNSRRDPSKPAGGVAVQSRLGTLNHPRVPQAGLHRAARPVPSRPVALDPLSVAVTLSRTSTRAATRTPGGPP